MIQIPGEMGAGVHVNAAFLAGAAAVIAAIGIVLKYLPRGKEGTGNGNGRDGARMLALLERQQDDMKDVVLQLRHDAEARVALTHTMGEFVTRMEKLGATLTEVVRQLGRSTDAVTAMRIEFDLLQRDVSAHRVATEASVSQIHRKIVGHPEAG